MPLNKETTPIITYYVLAFVCIYIALSDNKALNSLEELLVYAGGSR